MKPISALIVDDSSHSRQGMRALLSTCPEVLVVAEAEDGADAVLQIERWQPDAVLMDVQMPRLDGLGALVQIKERWPEIRVILLSIYPDYRQAALSAGAEAFLLKGCSLEHLLAALLCPPLPH